MSDDSRFAADFDAMFGGSVSGYCPSAEKIKAWRSDRIAAAMHEFRQGQELAAGVELELAAAEARGIVTGLEMAAKEVERTYPVEDDGEPIPPALDKLFTLIMRAKAHQIRALANPHKQGLVK